MGLAMTHFAVSRGNAGALRLVRGVSRNEVLRRVELAFLCFSMSEFGTWVAILVFAYSASGPELVGWVATAQLLPAALATPLTSTLADRFSRGRVLLVGYAAQSLTFAAAGSAMVIGAKPIVVYSLAAAAACAITITRPTQSALFPQIARTPDELTAANGLAGALEGPGDLARAPRSGGGTQGFDPRCRPAGRCRRMHVCASSSQNSRS